MASSNGPQSLYTYAKNVLIKYVHTLEDVADLEYRVLEPVLKKIASPHQLKKLEANSPQIAGEDVELWKKFIARDFGADAVEKWVPKNPKSWSKVYDKHQKEAEAAAARAAETLKAEFQGLNSSKDSGRTRLVAPSALPPIKKSKPWGSSGSGSGWGQSANSWNHQAGSKTKNIIQKARREAKEMSRFRSDRSVLARPVQTGSAAPAAHRLSESMKRKIKTAEEIRAEKEKLAEMSRRNGKASGALGKRKLEEREEEERKEREQEEGEEEKRRKTEEWRRKAMERRGPAVGGPRLKAVAAPAKKTADPFFRPQRANPLAIPPKRR